MKCTLLILILPDLRFFSFVFSFYLSFSQLKKSIFIFLSCIFPPLFSTLVVQHYIYLFINVILILIISLSNIYLLLKFINIIQIFFNKNFYVRNYKLMIGKPFKELNSNFYFYEFSYLHDDWIITWSFKLVSIVIKFIFTR